MPEYNRYDRYREQGRERQNGYREYGIPREREQRRPSEYRERECGTPREWEQRRPSEYREREYGTSCEWEQRRPSEYREREYGTPREREREYGTYREREQRPSAYREQNRSGYREQQSYGQRYASFDESHEEEPPPTLSGQLKLTKIQLRKLNRIIERAFPETPDQIANDLVRWTPRAITLCYTLLAMGIVASRLNIIWQNAGYLWGIASLSVIMIGVFFWVWSSNIVKIPSLSAKARTDLKRAMRIQSTTFIAAILSIIYFVGMALHYW